MENARRVTLRVVTLLAIVANVVFAGGVDLLGRFGLSGRSVFAEAARHHSAFAPASYAYAIWGLIYAAFLVYAVVQLLPRWRRRARLDAGSAMLLAVNLLGMSWVAVFRQDRLGLSVFIIACMLAAGVAMYASTFHLLADGAPHLWLFPSSLFVAWISVAALANVAALCVAHGFHGGAAGEVSWAIAMLAGLSLLGCALALRLGDFVFPLVIAWAAIAIGVEFDDPRSALALTAFVCAGVETIVATAVATSLIGPQAARLDSRPRVDTLAS